MKTVQSSKFCCLLRKPISIWPSIFSTNCPPLHNAGMTMCAYTTTSSIPTFATWMMGVLSTPSGVEPISQSAYTEWPVTLWLSRKHPQLDVTTAVSSQVCPTCMSGLWKLLRLIEMERRTTTDTRKGN